MTDESLHQLGHLSSHLARRRSAILDAWRLAANRDPQQTTVASLSRAQFNDHIPQVLDAFERKLRARPGGAGAAAADDAKTVEEVKHGLHRWQQGYRLEELMHEWGHLHLCLFDEIEAYAAKHPAFDRETLMYVNHQLILLVNESISESASQYARMQQAEAAGHARDLHQTLTRVKEMERARAQLIHQAVHDLRGNVQSVSSAADVLGEPSIPEADRNEFLDMLRQGTAAVSTMLTDLMALARLEAGQEQREIAQLDAATLLGDFCAAFLPFARERGLYLEHQGPPTLIVEGDAGKIRRLVQNLVLNALKYTEHGGVTVSWGEESDTSWWFMVKDTGPGLLSGPGSPLVEGMTEATASARESDENAAKITGEEPKVIALPTGDSGEVHFPTRQQAGEGIGLSIVKRLCDLLDASLEVTSSADSGTTFRIVLMRHYAAPAADQGLASTSARSKES